MKYKPLRYKVLVEPIEITKETATVVENGIEYSVKQIVGKNSLIIPNMATEKDVVKRGTVVALGKSASNEEHVLSIGNIVIYGKFAGSEVILDEKKYVILREEDILLIEA